MAQFLVALVLYFSLATVGATSTDRAEEPLATLTKANKGQRTDIYELIKKVDFDSCVAQDGKSTYTRYSAGKKNPSYRLDNEPKTSDKPPNAKLAIQLDGAKPSPTYATIVVKPNVNFGRSRIQQALRESVDNTEVKYLL